MFLRNISTSCVVFCFFDTNETRGEMFSLLSLLSKIG